jgi:hypothetical protein
MTENTDQFRQFTVMGDWKIGEDMSKFKREIEEAAALSGIQQSGGDVDLVIFYYHRYRRGQTLVNNCPLIAKHVMEALTGVAYHSSAQVRKVSAERWSDDDNPRVSVHVAFIHTTEPHYHTLTKAGK